MREDHQPKVSICIPAYENPKGIERLLQSILAQIDIDYEVIVTDDSGSNDVEEVVRRFETKLTSDNHDNFKDARVQYFHNKPSKGAVPNWNEAISHARGEYIKLMHHDDWFSDALSLRRMVDLLENQPDCDLAFSGTYQVAQGQEKIARAISREDAERIRSDWRNLYLGNTIGAPSAVIVKKSALDDKDIRYDTNLTWLVDEEYYMQILSHNPRFAYTELPLISIGLSKTQLTEQVGDDQKLVRREYRYIYDKYDLSKEKIFRDKLREIHFTKAKRYLDSAEYLYEKYLDRLNKSPAGKLLDLAFRCALLIEMGIVIVDKSALLNPYEGQLFRVTFLLFAISMLGTKYDRKNRLCIVGMLVVGAISYRCSGRNELLRIFVFVAAAIRMNIRKVLQTEWIITLFGTILLAVLSALGILGTVTVTGTFDAGVDTRLCLGMGHPNSFACMVAMLCLLGMYLFGQRMKIWHFAALFIFDIVLYLTTRSAAAVGLLGMGIIFYLLARQGKAVAKHDTITGQKKRRKSITAIWQQNAIYYIGEAALAAGLMISVVGAIYSPFKYPVIGKIDGLVTGRISALWDTSFHEGTLSTWTWFGTPINDYFFDMGWVRVVYWYGVIPAVLIIATVYMLCRKLRMEKNAAGFILLVLCCLYTVFEAHLVSEYLGRNFLLLLAAAAMQKVNFNRGAPTGHHT